MIAETLDGEAANFAESPPSKLSISLEPSLAPQAPSPPEPLFAPEPAFVPEPSTAPDSLELAVAVQPPSEIFRVEEEPQKSKRKSLLCGCCLLCCTGKKSGTKLDEKTWESLPDPGHLMVDDLDIEEVVIHEVNIQPSNTR